jgi:uncharacterized protein YbjT (DUF2867 family)
MPRILIIGATGTVGRQVVSQLSFREIPVRTLVRNPQTANLPPQVEIVRGDLTVPDSLELCLAGIDTVFLVWTAPPSAVAAALDRITRHARRIVFLSAPLKTPHPLFQQNNALRTLTEEIERRIEASAREWTFLRPGMFAANSLNWWAPQIRSGNLVLWPYLDVPTAPIDERDIAAVGVRALAEDSHNHAEYVMTGPQSLTHREQISTIADVLGRELRVEELSPDDARRVGLPSVPAGAQNMLLKSWAAAAGQPAYVTSTVERITGIPARTFRQWATDHISAFQPDRT